METRGTGCVWSSCLSRQACIGMSRLLCNPFGTWRANQVVEKVSSQDQTTPINTGILLLSQHENRGKDKYRIGSGPSTMTMTHIAQKSLRPSPTPRCRPAAAAARHANRTSLILPGTASCRTLRPRPRGAGRAPFLTITAPVLVWPVSGWDRFTSYTNMGAWM